MLNFIWLVLIALAVIIGGLRGNIGEVGDASVSSAKTAVDLALGLLGVMTMWLGLMRLADKAGLVRRLGLVLKPILRWIFPGVPANHPAMGAIVLNVSANILGLNNAATPLGLRAMNELNKLNPRPGVATDAMCMLLAINTSSITLIPVTAIGVLALYHGKNPTVIIGTSLAATACAQAVAITTCKLMQGMRWSQRQLEQGPETISAVMVTENQSSISGGEIEKKAEETDATLPWAPHAGRILAVFAGLFLATLFAFTFGGFVTQLQDEIDPARDFPVQLVQAVVLLATQLPAHIGHALNPEHWAALLRQLVTALSLLVLPWLILLFPLYAALRKIPVYDEFVEGGKEGFNVILRILPYIVAMLVAVGMFRAAGGMTLITWMLSPITNLIHFPSELVSIALIRPFSGTAALALLTDLAKNPAYGPDNIITLMAATFYGCSETTFYVIAVYFGSVGIKKTRHAIPVGLIADAVGPIAAVIICRAVLG
jgi:spore maturation protein SpmA/spore maturation protein SpmB